MHSNKLPHLKVTTTAEIKALIGLFYYRGLYNLSGHSAKVIFSEKMRLPMFPVVMSLNRFLLLVSLFFNWNSLHARPNSHFKAWSYTNKSIKRLKHTGKLCRKNLQLIGVC